MPRVFIWPAIALALGVPLALAAASPLLQWRDAFHITGGFAGIVGLGILLIQPLLAGGVLPGLSPLASRRLHRAVGTGLIFAILLHVAALWVTSPPDVIDVLLFRSPTPFAIWGMLAMLAAFAAAGSVMIRRRIRPCTWRLLHIALTALIIAGTLLHTLLIEGVMEPISKIILCILVAAAFAALVLGKLKRG